jgi:hypothetical protein
LHQIYLRGRANLEKVLLPRPDLEYRITEKLRTLPAVALGRLEQVEAQAGLKGAVKPKD